MTHPLFMKKKSILFNMGHILHRLDDLTDVIWVILSKKKILHRLFLRTNVIYSFLSYFEVRAAHSRTISLCHVIATSSASNVCHVQRVSIYRDSKYNSIHTFVLIEVYIYKIIVNLRN